MNRVKEVKDVVLKERGVRCSFGYNSLKNIYFALATEEKTGRVIKVVILHREKSVAIKLWNDLFTHPGSEKIKPKKMERLLKLAGLKK